MAVAGYRPARFSEHDVTRQHERLRTELDIQIRQPSCRPIAGNPTPPVDRATTGASRDLAGVHLNGAYLKAGWQQAR